MDCIVVVGDMVVVVVVVVPGFQVVECFDMVDLGLDGIMVGVVASGGGARLWIT